jgi:hypothetical protein
MAKAPAFAKAFAGRWRIVEWRGWASLGTAGRLVGHFYIHLGDDSGFVCERP